MKRYTNIFLLHFQQVFEIRSRSFVWFLVSLVNPVFYYLLWKGAEMEPGAFKNFDLNAITSYYLLLAMTGSFLMSHVEEDVAIFDIQKGDLSRYLLRPFRYYRIKFFEEVPYRIIQGAFGIMAFSVLFLIYGSFFKISLSWGVLLFFTVLAFMGYLLSFTFKMILGMTAFWLTDISPLVQLAEITALIFAGYILPLSLMPDALRQISYLLPFAYMIYFPVLTLEGVLGTSEMLGLFGLQIIWLAVLAGVYGFLWRRGIKKFTAVGR